jgi:8-oxo-dGTP pyrophosphatase MutT (NUDIX family)
VTYARRAARVILLDARGRVLLFHATWHPRRPELGMAWFTPGGGAEPGETPAETAARELREETGLAVEPEALGALVAWTEGEADLMAGQGTYRDDFFLLRVDAHEVSTAGHEALEAEHIAGYRWWPREELRASDERTIPYALADLLDLLDAGPPAEPVRLPWRPER